jgi:predicted alpha/beta superfamily hydrolase
MALFQSLCVLLVAIAATHASAEPVALPRTSIRNVTAKANGVAYKLYVSLPRGYESSDARYPVIYVLDADYSFAIAHNVVEHMAERDHLRWAIVVGIAYAGEPQYRVHRTRDYTPTHTLNIPAGVGHQQAWQKHSGGGPKFRDFLRRELVPLIDRSYRTSGERVLVGHSYGGLFATWLMLTEPDLFNGYVIVSPSLWYDERLMFSIARGAKRVPRGRAYLSAGALENSIMGSDVKALGARLTAIGGVDVRSEVLADETHNSIFPSAFSRGIRFVLKGR